MSDEDRLHDVDAVIDDIELADGRHILIRRSRAADGAALRQLTIALPRDDARRRFFSASLPLDSWFTHWASLNEHGGYGIVAFLRTADRSGIDPPAPNSTQSIATDSNSTHPNSNGPDHGEIIGEAGYALLPDGDGELALTVAESWRGWLGAYLLDVIVAHAAAAGIENLQANVLLENRPMLALLRHRGAVARSHSGGEVRMSISTTGYVPSWPPDDDRPRVLVEVPGGRWSGEPFAESAGLQIAVCSGPAHRRKGCPELCEGNCPLVDGADAIAVLLDPEDPQTVELLERHHRLHPDTPLFVRRATDDTTTFVRELGTGDTAVARITAAMADVAEHDGAQETEADDERADR